MRRTGYMFAGQGAQSVGMGRDLYENSPAARAVIDRADAVLGRSLSALCFEGPAEDLTASVNCQPAIYTVSVACAAALQERFQGKPVVCGGLSLGEFAALTCAGGIAFEAGLRLVAARGKCMDEACRAADGAMAAVIGADPAVVTRVCAAHAVDVANYNCPGQLVISGDRRQLGQAVTALAAAGVNRVILLDVAGAYHSRLMAPAADRFAPLVDAAPITAPICPLAQNAVGDVVTEVGAIRANLKAQVTGSVLWEACVGAMLRQGTEVLVELGPGKVLAGFMRRIDRAFPVCSVGCMADLDAAGALLGAS
ncbi:MAG: ACP S-malonyltransferase [Lentisphaeria bacterium]|nr:ACP S-malonyltransferase [Lentisphaeria bacterium]